MKATFRHWINRFLEFLTSYSFILFAMVRKKLNIIQIGANDGQSIDHMHSLVRKMKSTAVVVEPVPHVFKVLKSNYASFPNVVPKQLAITDKSDEYHKTFHYLSPRHGEEFNEIYSFWGSFSLDHLQRFKSFVPNFENLLVSEEVACLSLNALIEDTGFNPIHILATDTEGYDGKIINSLDFELYRPELIFFEHIHIPTNELHALLQRLGHEKYRCYSYGYNTWCFGKGVEVADIPLRVIKKLFPRALSPQNLKADIDVVNDSENI